MHDFLTNFLVLKCVFLMIHTYISIAVGLIMDTYVEDNRYDKHVRYESRKVRAESRTRIKGRFAKIDH